jgi:hypothetical protein
VTLRFSVVPVVLLLTAPAFAADEIVAEEPFIAPKDPPKPAPCGDCIRALIAGEVGGEVATMFRSGPTDGAPGFALGVSGVLGGLVQTRRTMHYLVLDASLGVGFAGVQGTFDGLYAFGVHVPVDHRRIIDMGPFLRVGVSGLAISNNRTFVDVLDLPFGDVGWSYIGDRFGFQLYGRVGLAATTRMSSGRRFEDRDARRELDPSFETGFGAGLGIGERLYIDSRFVHIVASDLQGTPVDYAVGRFCFGIKDPVAACLRTSFATSDVLSRDAATDTWSRATTGYVGISIGIGAAGVIRDPSL